MKKTLNNFFQDIPKTLDNEFLEVIVQGSQVKIERIVSRGHTSPRSGWYNQNQNEWVMVLQGAAILTLEDGEQIRLSSGDHLTIPAHCKHRVSWTEPQTDTIWLAVHYS